MLYGIWDMLTFPSLLPASPPHSSRLGGKESGQLTEAGHLFSQQLVGYLKYEQEHDLVGTGKDFIVMTGTGMI
ncbi:hypothetical protein EON63_12525 [archaeon]|nr:MAG: hypothetical protein EON63_12525 [archaeon]